MLRFIGFYDYTVVLTYLSLVSAISGIIAASHGKFHTAVLCLLFSGICDAFDGTVARTKKNRTEDEKAFGIQLDSLCDVISFGVFPAMICYFKGVDGVVGIVILMAYCLCALIRLAFFNVMEAKRQKVQGGCNKYYRGLPVTSISITFPLIYLMSFIVSDQIFAVILHIVMALTAFLFVFDFSVKKPDVTRLFCKK